VDELFFKEMQYRLPFEQALTPLGSFDPKLQKYFDKQRLLQIKEQQSWLNKFLNVFTGYKRVLDNDKA